MNCKKQRQIISDIAKIVSQSDILSFQGLVKQILIEPHLITLQKKIVLNTRENPFIFRRFQQEHQLQS
jgi:MoxR-like ATPase